MDTLPNATSDNSTADTARFKKSTALESGILYPTIKYQKRETVKRMSKLKKQVRLIGTQYCRMIGKFGLAVEKPDPRL